MFSITAMLTIAGLPMKKTSHLEKTSSSIMFFGASEKRVSHNHFRPMHAHLAID